MNICKLEQIDFSKYEDYVVSHKDGLFYYSVKYKQFLEQLCQVESHYLIAKDNDRIVGTMPLMIKKGAFGSIINSLPYYGSNGGILADLEEVSDELRLKYSEMIKDGRYSASTCVENPLNPYAVTYDFDFIDERIGQWTELKEQSSDGLMSAFDSSTRRNIRKAEKQGVDVIIDNSAIEFLKQTHKANMADIGGLAKSDQFFDMIPDCFEGDKDYRIYVAQKNGKAVAALLLFYFNHTVEYFTPVTVSEYRSDQPLAGIVFKAMCDAIDQGFDWWNWGGTWKSQEGVYKFKKKWAAIDKPYRYFTKIFNQELLFQSRETLLSEYANFFVVSFDELKEKSYAE